MTQLEQSTRLPSVDDKPSLRVPWLAVLVGPVLALTLYFPTLFGTFLSDDYLANMMLTHEAEPRVDWDTVIADFGREWMGLEGGGMYRPLVSMSFALNYLAGGCNPAWFHLVNVLIHALTAFTCALVCVRCSTQRPAIAAVLGGALIAVHPAFAESSCWISARNSGIQVLFATVSMLGFISYRQSGRSGYLGLCIIGFLAALMTKETAVLLPFSFLALDALVHGWTGLRRRGVHLAMFAILAGYFGMRYLLLGVLLGGDSEGLESIQSNDILNNALAKAELLVIPVGSSYPPAYGEVFGYLCLAGLGLLVVPAFLRLTTAWVPLLLITWIGLHFAPSYRLIVDTHTLSGSRLVIGATTVMAIGLAFLATRSRWPGITRLAIASLLCGLTALSIGRMTAFLRAYEDMRSLRADLNSAAAESKPSQPIGVVAINRAIDGVTFLNCNATFPLLEKPNNPTDKPLVSLGFVFQPVPASEHLLFDVGPWRALREMGATLFEWHRSPNIIKPTVIVDRRTLTPPKPLPVLKRSTTGNGTDFLAKVPLDVWQIEALEIEVEGSCTGGDVDWLYAGTNGEPKEYAKFRVPPAFQDAPSRATFGRPTARNSNSVFYVDVSHHLTLLAVGQLGGLAGVKIHTQGPKVQVVGVRLLPRLGTLPIQHLAGTEVTLDNTQAHLFAPKLPAGAEAMTIYLMGPDTTLTMPVRPGGVKLTSKVQSAISVILRSSRQKRYYYYYEATGTRSWRSAVDWIVFRPK
ncbi:MAG: hypothetical protein VX951_06395 [Planctomycetota bacterium]|nr:hypothetical protein [Planctomycetota bacterium]